MFEVQVRVVVLFEMAVAFEVVVVYEVVLAADVWEVSVYGFVGEVVFVIQMPKLYLDPWLVYFVVAVMSFVVLVQCRRMSLTTSLKTKQKMKVLV